MVHHDSLRKKLDVTDRLAVTGPVSVHGLGIVNIHATVLPSLSALAEGDPMKNAVFASTGDLDAWIFIAQQQNGYTHFLSAEHVENGSS